MNCAHTKLTTIKLNKFEFISNECNPITMIITIIEPIVKAFFVAPHSLQRSKIVIILRLRQNKYTIKKCTTNQPIRITKQFHFMLEKYMRYAFALFVNWMNLYILCFAWIECHIHLYFYMHSNVKVKQPRSIVCFMSTENLYYQFWTYCFFSSSKNNKKKVPKWTLWVWTWC